MKDYYQINLQNEEEYELVIAMIPQYGKLHYYIEIFPNQVIFWKKGIKEGLYNNWKKLTQRFYAYRSNKKKALGRDISKEYWKYIENDVKAIEENLDQLIDSFNKKEAWVFEEDLNTLYYDSIFHIEAIKAKGGVKDGI